MWSFVVYFQTLGKLSKLIAAVDFPGQTLYYTPNHGGDMKYIIFEDFSGEPAAFLFPQRVDHADMREQMPYAKVLSAGWVSFDGEHFTCTGGSLELNVQARREDVEIIAGQFNPEQSF